MAEDLPRARAAAPDAPVAAHLSTSGLPPPSTEAAMVRPAEAAMPAGSPVAGSRLAAMDGYGGHRRAPPFHATEHRPGLWWRGRGGGAEVAHLVAPRASLRCRRRQGGGQ